MVSPSLDIFLLLLNEKILYERIIAVKNNNNNNNLLIYSAPFSMEMIKGALHIQY